MSDILIEYEKSFIKIEDKINNIFKQITILEVNNYTEKEKLMNEVNLLIIEQEKILKQMEFEILSLTKEKDYKSFNSKIISYHKNLTTNKNNYLKIEEKKRKNEIKGNISNNELLNDKETNNYLGNLKLEEARRILANTEDIGNQIIVNMDEQSNKMKDLNYKVNNMNNELDESNKILDKMKSKFLKIFSYFSKEK